EVVSVGLADERSGGIPRVERDHPRAGGMRVDAEDLVPSRAGVRRPLHTELVGDEDDFAGWVGGYGGPKVDPGRKGRPARSAVQAAEAAEREGTTVEADC